MGNKIEIDVIVNSSIEEVWEFWTNPQHIVNWNFASDDWECPKAINDLRVEGKFSYTMAAKDGSMKFDFEGIYTKVEKPNMIEYELEDKRKVFIKFISEDDTTKIIESFEVEGTNNDEYQKEGWQCILNNFKKYVENKND
ncbi:MAG: SRPBCC domain-containing protein [Nanoarchaeota archaeon]|nr:SRPBCC domain-containing protein [Nanoarchaeota archaeon]